MIHIGISDDYAIISTPAEDRLIRRKPGTPEFYYGYEEVDDQDNWLFTVKIDGAVVFSKTTQELDEAAGRAIEFPHEYLITGMYLYCQDQREKLLPANIVEGIRAGNVTPLSRAEYREKGGF